MIQRPSASLSGDVDNSSDDEELHVTVPTKPRGAMSLINGDTNYTINDLPHMRDPRGEMMKMIYTGRMWFEHAGGVAKIDQRIKGLMDALVVYWIELQSVVDKPECASEAISYDHDEHIRISSMSGVHKMMEELVGVNDDRSKKLVDFLMSEQIKNDEAKDRASRYLEVSAHYCKDIAKLFTYNTVMYYVSVLKSAEALFDYCIWHFKHTNKSNDDNFCNIMMTALDVAISQNYNRVLRANADVGTQRINNDDITPIDKYFDVMSNRSFSLIKRLEVTTDAMHESNEMVRLRLDSCKKGLSEIEEIDDLIYVHSQNTNKMSLDDTLELKTLKKTTIENWNNLWGSDLYVDSVLSGCGINVHPKVILGRLERRSISPNNGEYNIYKSDSVRPDWPKIFPEIANTEKLIHNRAHNTKEEIDWIESTGTNTRNLMFSLQVMIEQLANTSETKKKEAALEINSTYKEEIYKKEETEQRENMKKKREVLRANKVWATSPSTIAGLILSNQSEGERIMKTHLAEKLEFERPSTLSSETKNTGASVMTSEGNNSGAVLSHITRESVASESAVAITDNIKKRKLDEPKENPTQNKSKKN